MRFSQLAQFLQKLEQTASRNTMTEILAELLKTSSAQEVDKICYLTQGRVAPLFVPLEFGVADKMMIQVLGRACEVRGGEVVRLFGKLGDLGAVAEQLKIKNEKLKIKGLTISEVFGVLERIAKAGGEGSVEEKTSIMVGLLQKLDPLSARYVVRVPLGKLRLGFSDMTILDALSWMLGRGKGARPEIEKAYNVRPDLGYIAKVVKEKGVRGLEKVGPEVGTPILMARAERLSSAKEIIDKIGKCAVEGKIDGFRVAVHKDGKKVQMFSRNMENTTKMYPDLVKEVLSQVKQNKVIFEGEAIGYNPQTGEFLPFQETVQRKRKYDIERMAEEVPLRLICFDCLYVDGKNLINEGYLERRKWLEGVVGKGETLLLSEAKITDDPIELETIFQEAIARGLEGVMAKKLDGVYQAGARGWNWIKLKRSYQGKLEDTIDAVVMGYDFGQGKRAGFGIGDFLIGVYDQSVDTFKTIAKIGTGLSDEEWRTMKKKCNEMKAGQKPARYDVDKLMSCNIWVEPAMVVVIRADEISRSPVHTAGRVMGLSKSGGAQEVKIPGFALRFPRLVDFRDDKVPEDATSVKEVEEMFKLQKKK